MFQCPGQCPLPLVVLHVSRVIAVLIVQPALSHPRQDQASVQTRNTITTTRKVYDASARTTLPQVNVALKGSRSGAISDPDNPQSLSGDHVWALCEDRSGGLRVGTREGGLNRLIRHDEGSGTDGTMAFVRFQHDPTDPQSLSHNDVYAIHQGHTGTLWIGTYGGGLNKMILPAGSIA